MSMAAIRGCVPYQPLQATNLAELFGKTTSCGAFLLPPGPIKA